MTTSVTPVAGLTSQVAIGGTPVVVFPGGINGGFITNPANAVESLFVNPVGSATTTPNGTTFELAPGMTWTAIPGQSTATTVNAASNNHSFSAVSW